VNREEVLSEVIVASDVDIVELQPSRRLDVNERAGEGTAVCRRCVFHR